MPSLLNAMTLSHLLDEVDNQASFWQIGSPSKSGKKPPNGRPPWGRQRPPAAQASSQSAAALPVAVLPPTSPPKRSGMLSPPRARPPVRTAITMQKRPDASLHAVCSEKLPATPISTSDTRPTALAGATVQPAAYSTESRTSSSVQTRRASPKHQTLADGGLPRSPSAISFRPDATASRSAAAEMMRQPSPGALSALFQSKQSALHRSPSRSTSGWGGSHDGAGQRASAAGERSGSTGTAGIRGVPGPLVSLGDAFESPPHAQDAEAWLNRMLGMGLTEALPPSQESALLRRIGADRDLIEEMEDLDLGLTLKEEESVEASVSFELNRGRGSATSRPHSGAGRPPSKSSRLPSASSRPSSGGGQPQQGRPRSSDRPARAPSAGERTRRLLRQAASGLQAAGLDRASLWTLGIRTDSQVNQLYNLIFVYSFGVRDSLARLMAHATPEGRGELGLRAWRTLVGLAEQLMRDDLGSEIASAIASLEDALAAAESDNAHAAVAEAAARHALEARVDELLASRDAAAAEQDNQAAELREVRAALAVALGEVDQVRMRLAEATAAAADARREAEAARLSSTAASGALDAARAGSAAAAREAAVATEVKAPRAELAAAREDLAGERERRVEVEARVEQAEVGHAACR